MGIHLHKMSNGEGMTCGWLTSSSLGA